VHALGGRAGRGRGGEMVGGVDAPDDQDLIFQLDLTPDVGGEALVARVDVARLQRTAEGAGQSAAGGRHDIVERRGMGLDDVRVDLVVGGHRAMHAERHGDPLRRQVGLAQRPGLALDPYV
jgi:hypothetical protein